MSHTHWGKKTRLFLLTAGLSEDQIAQEKARRTALCRHEARSGLPRFTSLLQQALFRYGIDPHTTERIAEHLKELCNKILRADPEDEDAVDRLREKDRERMQTYRENNREYYNERQKLLMRERRAKAKQLSEAGKRASKSRKTAPKPELTHVSTTGSFPPGQAR